MNRRLGLALGTEIPARPSAATKITSRQARQGRQEEKTDDRSQRTASP